MVSGFASTDLRDVHLQDWGNERVHGHEVRRTAIELVDRPSNSSPFPSELPRRPPKRHKCRWLLLGSAIALISLGLLAFGAITNMPSLPDQLPSQQSAPASRTEDLDFAARAKLESHILPSSEFVSRRAMPTMTTRKIRTTVQVKTITSSELFKDPDSQEASAVTTTVSASSPQPVTSTTVMTIFEAPEEEEITTRTKRVTKTKTTVATTEATSTVRKTTTFHVVKTIKATATADVSVSNPKRHAHRRASRHFHDGDGILATGSVQARKLTTITRARVATVASLATSPIGSKPWTMALPTDRFTTYVTEKYTERSTPQTSRASADPEKSTRDVDDNDDAESHLEKRKETWTTKTKKLTITSYTTVAVLTTTTVYSTATDTKFRTTTVPTTFSSRTHPTSNVASPTDATAFPPSVPTSELPSTTSAAEIAHPPKNDGQLPCATGASACVILAMHAVCPPCGMS